MTTCPTCGTSVDPLRSRYVGVSGGKIVAYCSAECAAPAQRAHAPAAAPSATLPAERGEIAAARMSVPDGPPRPSTPPAGVPVNLDSGPVIQILYEPSSGVVTSARDERTEPRGEHPQERSGGISGAAAKDSGAVRAASALDSAPVELPSAGPDDVLDQSTTASVTAQPRNESKGEVASHKRRASLWLLLLILLGAAGVLAYQYLIKPDLAGAAKALPVPAASVPQAVQVAVAEPRHSPAVAVAPAVDVAPTVEVTPAVEVAAAIDVAAAVEQARATLQADLTATSQRLSRIAAAALARTQDLAACDALAAQLGLGGARDRPGRPGSPGPAGVTGSDEPAGVAEAAAPAEPERSKALQSARQPETSDIAKLDLAYSLARGGDKRGSDILAVALRAQRADVRDEAARLLALLGDRRAVPHLTDLLAVPQRRLGAAEHLAHLAEPRTIKVLAQIRGDAKTSANDKARAIIALGIAGHPEVAAALRDMLGDPHESAFAAAALAELKDAAARPVLEHQLESPMLRVRAARALRRLDPALDPKPVLPPLLHVLKSGRDIDQIQAAEAILLLAGPASWSAYE